MDVRGERKGAGLSRMYKKKSLKKIHSSNREENDGRDATLHFIEMKSNSAVMMARSHPGERGNCLGDMN